MMVEADYPVHFGPGLLQHLGDNGNRAFGNVADPVLDSVKNGKQGAGFVLQCVHFVPDYVRCPVAGAGPGGVTRLLVDLL